MKSITWYQLLNRLNKQPLNIVKNRNVQIKINGELRDCYIVFDSGVNFHLEVVE